MTGKTISITNFDRRLGRLIVMHRRCYGLSQKDLANALNCSFQQIQKYETASNRMSTARLYELCKYFRMPIGTFLQEAVADYVHDPKMAQIIQNLYGLKQVQVDLILQMTDMLRHANTIKNVR